MKTYDFAKMHGAGAILSDGIERYEVSDWSDGARTAYGWKLRMHAEGPRLNEHYEERRVLKYGALPEGLQLRDRRADLAAQYLEEVGYNPFDDCPTISDDEIAYILQDMREEAQAAQDS